jgi:hypothetical protein
MLTHAARAARFGALWTALVAVVAAFAVAFLAPPPQTEGGLLSGPVVWVPALGLAGAVAGATVFGLIGLVVAAIYVKPVGWTFVYSFFGAGLALAATLALG